MEKRIVVDIERMQRAGACYSVNVVKGYDGEAGARYERTDYEWYLPGVGKVVSLNKDRFEVVMTELNRVRLAIVPWLNERHVTYSVA